MNHNSSQRADELNINPIYYLKNPRRLISQGQGIYFSRPEKHPFSGHKSTHFPLKNHYILWFYPPFLFKTASWNLNYCSLMYYCRAMDTNNINLLMNPNHFLLFHPYPLRGIIWQCSGHEKARRFKWYVVEGSTWAMQGTAYEFHYSYFWSTRYYETCSSSC